MDDSEVTVGFVCVGEYYGADGSVDWRFTNSLPELMNPDAIVMPRGVGSPPAQWLPIVESRLNAGLKPYETRVVRISAGFRVLDQPIIRQDVESFKQAAIDRCRVVVKRGMTCSEVVREDSRFYFLAGKRARKFFSITEGYVVLCYDPNRVSRLKAERPRKPPKLRLTYCRHIERLALGLHNFLNREFSIRVNVVDKKGNRGRTVLNFGCVVDFMRRTKMSWPRFRKKLYSSFANSHYPRLDDAGVKAFIELCLGAEPHDDVTRSFQKTLLDLKGMFSHDKQSSGRRAARSRVNRA